MNNIVKKYISTGQHVLYTLEGLKDLNVDYKTAETFFDGTTLYRIIKNLPDENGFIECKEFAPYYPSTMAFFDKEK
jgi:hypothetical protein